MQNLALWAACTAIAANLSVSGFPLVDGSKKPNALAAFSVTKEMSSQNLSGNCVRTENYVRPMSFRNLIQVAEAFGKLD